MNCSSAQPYPNAMPETPEALNARLLTRIVRQDRRIVALEVQLAQHQTGRLAKRMAEIRTSASDEQIGDREFQGRQLVLPGRVSTVGLDLPPDLTFEQWSGIGAALRGVNRSLQWWLGDWLRYGERRYGEMYAQAVEDTGKNYQTLANAKWVAERFADFSLRRENLSWSHHKEVAGRADAAELLDLAERADLSVRDLHAEVSRRKAACAIAAPHANDDTCPWPAPWLEGDRRRARRGVPNGALQPAVVQIPRHARAYHRATARGHVAAERGVGTGGQPVRSNRG